MTQFKVYMWVGASKTDVVVTAQNSAHAMQVARKLFPMAIVINAKKQ